MYIKAIITKGLILPCAVCGLLGIAATYGAGYLNENILRKTLTHEAYKYNQTKLDKIKTTIQKKEKHYKKWKTYMNTPARDRITKITSDIGNNLNPDKIIKLGGQEIKGISQITTNRQATAGINTYRFNQEWEGSYNAIQALIAQQEALAPDWILESLTLRPANSSELEFPSLRTDIQYTVWDSKIETKP